MKVAIAGAGVGAPAAALCLHERGCAVQVFEAVDSLHPLGVGINVMPHATDLFWIRTPKPISCDDPEFPPGCCRGTSAETVERRRHSRRSMPHGEAQQAYR